MKQISLKSIVVLLIYSDTANAYNKVNMKSVNSYQDFFDNKLPDLKLNFIEITKSLAEAMKKDPDDVVLKVYQDKYESILTLSENILKNYFKQYNNLDIELKDTDSLINLYNKALREDIDFFNEIISVPDELFFSLKQHFIATIPYIQQRWQFVVPAKIFENFIPKNQYPDFYDLHRKLQGKRLTGDPSSLFRHLRDFFDVEDEEWLNAKV